MRVRVGQHNAKYHGWTQPWEHVMSCLIRKGIFCRVGKGDLVWHDRHRAIWSVEHKVEKALHMLPGESHFAADNEQSARGFKVRLIYSLYFFFHLQVTMVVSRCNKSHREHRCGITKICLGYSKVAIQNCMAECTSPYSRSAGLRMLRMLTVQPPKVLPIR